MTAPCLPITVYETHNIRENIYVDQETDQSTYCRNRHHFGDRKSLHQESLERGPFPLCTFLPSNICGDCCRRITDIIFIIKRGSNICIWLPQRVKKFFLFILYYINLDLQRIPSDEMKKKTFKDKITSQLYITVHVSPKNSNYLAAEFSMQNEIPKLS